MADSKIKEFRELVKELAGKEPWTEDEEFMVIEALEYLIENEHNPNDMAYLGGIYYGDRKFDLALKYYEMAAGYDHVGAISGLGYIWYYGRTGEKDYKKAFEYYKKAAELGDLQCEYKMADMYKNGYYVEKDYGKYKKIIKSMEEKVAHARYLNEPLPEVYTRLANICKEEGDTDKALWLFITARDFLAQRIKYNNFFGNITIMEWLINDLYKITEIDRDYFDFFDLFEVLKTPCKVSFCFEDEQARVESVQEEDGTISIEYKGIWYRTIRDFITKGKIKGEYLTAVNGDLYDFHYVEN